VDKYVVLSTLETPEWKNTTILRCPLEEEVRALTEAPRKEVGVTGSISVVRSLIAAGLVDAYRLFVYPVVLSRGERLFVDAGSGSKLDWCRRRRSPPASVMSYRTA
jgi:dihydrofolate reductase